VFFSLVSVSFLLSSSGVDAVMTKYEKRNAQQVRRILKSVVYPENLRIMEAYFFRNETFPAFDPQVRGRANPLGLFSDYALSLEYFYGLALQNSLAVALEALVVQGNTAYARFTYILRTGPLPIIGFFKFNRQSQVILWDFDIINIGLSLDLLSPNFLVICQTIMQFCVGSNAQYTSVDECMNFLSNDIPLGSFDRTASNSVRCREIHVMLIVWDPATHCPHVGITGGNACIDTPVGQPYLPLSGLYKNKTLAVSRF